MALTSNDERRSMRRVLRNEAQQQVLALNVSYGERETILQMECINPEYCKEHLADVQEAVSRFLCDANAELEGEGLVQIK